ncbi:hypothetical protein H6784_00850 [Candidatus Nomurabacteria bacterium]|nr:hypothetical protein [Candidatus Kaiserbacteria bacterium]MCB9813940.1 hypothetical protein [Candidatus Nomurabacteria bacterium]
MEFLGNLGIDLGLLLAQVVNFGLLLFLLTKFVYRPIITRIEKDEKELQLVRTERETLDKKSAELQEKERLELIKVKKHAQSIIEEAEEIAANINERAQIESKQEKEAVIAQIRQQLNDLNHD